MANDEATKLPTACEFLFGKLIGKYRIVDVIGFGGMSFVLDVECGVQDEPTSHAMKIVWIRDIDGALRERFLRETRALNTLDHPGIVRIIEAGFDEGPAPQGLLTGQPFIVMERIRGGHLGDYLRQHLDTWRAVLPCFLQICEAMEYAHANNIVHCDLKPKNILIQNGQPKIVDFGIARFIGDPAEVEGEVVRASMPYACPELIAGGSTPADPRWDVYSLGVLLYEMLTREHPLETKATTPGLPSTAPSPILARPLQAPPLSPPIPRELSWIVDKALAQNIEDRYAAVRDLAEDLRRLQRYQVVSVAPPSWLYRIRLALRRHPVVASAFVVAFAWLGSAWFAQGENRSLDAENRSLSSANQGLGVQNLEFKTDQSEATAENRQLREQLRALEEEIALFPKRDPWASSEARESSSSNIDTPAHRDTSNAALLEPPSPQSLEGPSEFLARLAEEYGPLDARHLDSQNLAALELFQGRPEAAISTLNPTMEEERTLNARQRITLADAYVQLERWDEAIAEFTRSIELDSSNAEPLYKRGIAYAVRRDYPRAEQNFRRAVECDPGHAPAWSNLGVALRRLNRIDEAIEAFQHSAEADLSNPSALYLLGTTAFRQGDVETAIAWHEKALERNLNYYPALNALATTLAGRDPKRAEACMRRAVNLVRSGQHRAQQAASDPLWQGSIQRSVELKLTWGADLSVDLYNLGHILADQDRHKEAIEAFEESIQRRPEAFPDALNMLGLSCVAVANEVVSTDPLEAKRLRNQALSSYSTAIAHGLSLAFHNRARLKWGAGDLIGSLEDFEHSFLRAKNANGLLHRGEILGQQGNWAGAGNEYRRHIAVRPKDAIGYFQLGLALNKLDDVPAAIEAFEEASRREPTHWKARLNQGILMCDHGQPGTGIDRLREALKVAPKNHAAQCTDTLTAQLNRHAWKVATFPTSTSEDGMAALQYANESFALKDHWSALNVKAACLALAGQYEAAAQTQQTAIDRAGSEATPEMGRCLEQYTSGNRHFERPP